MLFYDDISKILDDIILSQMDVSACRSLLDSLFPYGYHSVNSDCYDVRKEIILNGSGDYHITAYDLPYIDACKKLVKFESNYEGSYPIMFAMLDDIESKLDCIACSLIKIFSCAYDDPALMIFISDERVAFGTVRSEKHVEDNFCISNWFLPADFDTKISFVEDAYSLSDVIGWIKDNSQLEKTKAHSKMKKCKTNSKMQSWNYDCYEFNLDYIHALSEFQYYTGVSTERQRHEYYLEFDEETRENRSAVIDEEDNLSLGYTFDDIASEITYVGNVTHFEELDEYSDNLETSEINDAAVTDPDSFDSLDFDDNIPDDVLNDPEKLLRYLGGNMLKHQIKSIRKKSKVKSEQIMIDSLKTPVPVENVAPVKKPITDVQNVKPIDCSSLEEPVNEKLPQADTAVNEVFEGKPLADIVQDFETPVTDLFDDAQIQEYIPESKPETNDIPEDKPFSDVVQDLESAVNGLFDEEPVLKIQEPKTVPDGVTGDAFDVNENQKLGTIVGDESEEDEAQEPDNIVSLQSDEQSVIDEIQELESTTGNVSAEELAIDKIKKSVNNIDGGEPVVDTSGMISHFELISMVNVHSETVFRYIHEHKIIPDRVIQSGSRVRYFFSQDNVQAIIKKYDWHVISESNKRRVFLQMINKMTMSFSYKPVFIKAFFATAKNGKTSMSKIVEYFRDFYEARRKAGLFVEKPNSVFANLCYSDKDVKKLILVYPYKRFAEMQMFTYSKLFGTVSMDPTVWSSLHSSEIIEICRMCNEHIKTYYSRFK